MKEAYGYVYAVVGEDEGGVGGGEFGGRHFVRGIRGVWELDVVGFLLSRAKGVRNWRIIAVDNVRMRNGRIVSVVFKISC